MLTYHTHEHVTLIRNAAYAVPSVYISALSLSDCICTLCSIEDPTVIMLRNMRETVVKEDVSILTCCHSQCHKSKERVVYYSNHCCASYMYMYMCTCMLHPEN